MADKSFHGAFLDELRDAYDAEKQLVKALPKMAKAADDDELRSAFAAHLEETKGHVETLEEVFASLNEKATGKHCDGIAGIIKEGSAAIEEGFDEATHDACLIAGGQRAEHYEIAAYGSLIAWAKSMGHDTAVGLLERILAEEKAADQKLTDLAESGINERAAQGADADEEETETRSTSTSTSGNRSTPRSTQGAKATRSARR